MNIPHKTNEVVIFGIGQIASVAYFYLTHDSPFEVVSCTVDRHWLKKSKYHD